MGDNLQKTQCSTGVQCALPLGNLHQLQPQRLQCKLDRAPTHCLEKLTSCCYLNFQAPPSDDKAAD